MTLILVLYDDGLLLTGNEPLVIKVRGSWLLKLEITLETLVFIIIIKVRGSITLAAQ